MQAIKGVREGGLSGVTPIASPFNITPDIRALRTSQGYRRRLIQLLSNHPAYIAVACEFFFPDLISLLHSFSSGYQAF